MTPAQLGFKDVRRLNHLQLEFTIELPGLKSARLDVDKHGVEGIWMAEGLFFVLGPKGLVAFTAHNVRHFSVLADYEKSGDYSGDTESVVATDVVVEQPKLAVLEKARKGRR